MKAILVLAPLLIAMSLLACTAEQAYLSSQAWQRNQCSKIPDKAEFDRCMRDKDTTYEAYKRQTGSEPK